jgi:integrase
VGQEGRQAAEEREKAMNTMLEGYVGLSEVVTRRVSDGRTKSEPKGIFQRPAGSGVYWVRYADATGRIRREKAGTKSAALTLYRKRKTEALQGRKLPETLRKRVVRFPELAEDARKYVKGNNEGAVVDCYRIDSFIEAFGNRSAEIPIEDFREWFADQEWAPGTYNRYRTVLSLIYRLGIENKKVDSNPAKLLKHKTEDNGRVRFLNQFQPAPTNVDFLKPHQDEESCLRAVIKAEYARHMPELDIALNTGMRRKEQYLRIDWNCVDLSRRDLYIPPSKNGKSRHVPLNDEAFAAFKELHQRTGGKGPIFVANNGERLLGARHWFEDAIEKAAIRDFTWHDLRHTFASRLVMAGVDLRTVADLMGHKNIQMTMRYAHLAPAHKLAAVERLAEFGARQAGPISSNSLFSYQSIPQAVAGSVDAERDKTARPTGTKTSTGAFQSHQADSSYVQ